MDNNKKISEDDLEKLKSKFNDNDKIKSSIEEKQKYINKKPVKK